SYIAHCVKSKESEIYELSHPALFRHYFQFWSPRKPFAALSADDVEERTARIQSRLPVIHQSLSIVGVDIDHVELILFVGTGTSNGHAFFDGEKFCAWIPVEMYSTAQS